MKIYQQEILDGLEPLIKNNAIAYNLNFKVVDIGEKPSSKAIAAAGANPDQIDLLYLETILASTGMNENDDIFLSSEIAKAKSTPVDKPFNYMHDESFIIGHITSSKLVDRDGNEIEYTDDSELPIELDIVTGSVIYKHYENEEKLKFINKLIEGIKNDEYFVSMECLFNNFDYGLVDAEGNQRIIPRTKETAFLSKYLRRYKGTGEYQNCRIGRVLRNFVFSGKGLVDNPANKRSHILSVANKQELEMTKNNDATTVVAEGLKPMVSAAEYESVKAELAEMKKAIASKVEAEIESYKTAIASVNTELENVKKLSAQKDEKIAELEKSISDINEMKSALEKELNSLKTERVLAARVAALIEVGVEKSKAEELVKTFASADDSLFNEVVKLSKKEKVEATTTTVTTDVLDNAKPTESAPLGTPTEDKTEQVRASVAKWASNFLKKTSK